MQDQITAALAVEGQVCVSRNAGGTLRDRDEQRAIARNRRADDHVGGCGQPQHHRLAPVQPPAPIDSLRHDLCRHHGEAFPRLEVSECQSELAARDQRQHPVGHLPRHVSQHTGCHDRAGKVGRPFSRTSQRGKHDPRFRCVSAQAAVPFLQQRAAQGNLVGESRPQAATLIPFPDDGVQRIRQQRQILLRLPVHENTRSDVHKADYRISAARCNFILALRCRLSHLVHSTSDRRGSKRWISDSPA